MRHTPAKIDLLLKLGFRRQFSFALQHCNGGGICPDIQAIFRTLGRDVETTIQAPRFTYKGYKGVEQTTAFLGDMVFVADTYVDLEPYGYERVGGALGTIRKPQQGRK